MHPDIWIDALQTNESDDEVVEHDVQDVKEPEKNNNMK
jgi:hypothetical protein